MSHGKELVRMDQEKRGPGKPVVHKPVMCMETGEVFKTYTEAGKAVGGSRYGVRKVAEGTQSHHHGKHFVFIEKENDL